MSIEKAPQGTTRIDSRDPDPFTSAAVREAQAAHDAARQADNDIVAQARARAKDDAAEARAAALATPEGRAEIRRREEEDDRARMFAAEAELAQDAALDGLQQGDVLSRITGTRNSIRAKSQQLLAQSPNYHGHRA